MERLNKMKTKSHWVSLQDELPKIGSGWRKMNVTFGRKWVYLEYDLPDNRSVKYKLTHRKWNELAGRMEKYWKRNGGEDSDRNTFT